MDAPYLSPQEVAELLGTSKKSVLRVASSDPTMPCIRLTPQLVRFPQERLRTWLRDREQAIQDPGALDRVSSVFAS